MAALPNGKIQIGLNDGVIHDTGFVNISGSWLGIPVGGSNPSTVSSGILNNGAMYFNTSTNKLFVYSGGIWVGVALT